MLRIQAKNGVYVWRKILGSGSKHMRAARIVEKLLMIVFSSFYFGPYVLEFRLLSDTKTVYYGRLLIDNDHCYKRVFC